MTKSYYDLLGVAQDAPADEIKRAFRREIARYHPDKVQHLGHEFREIAAVKAAELTQAYTTLTDESRRADYDAQLAAATPLAAESVHTAAAPEPDRSHTVAAAGPAPAPGPDRPLDDGTFSAERAGVGDLVRKAALARFRQALNAEFGPCDDEPVPGFDIACAPPKGRFWSKLPPRVLARVVAHVDSGAISESWARAVRLRKDDQREVCVFVMGPAVAPAAELARAIAEERRRPMPAGSRLTLVPVNTRSWSAYVPNDAPAAVKSLITRLKSA